MRKNVLPFALILFLVVLVFIAHSQGNPLKPMRRLVPNTPIDGSIFILLSAGLFYGAKILYRKD